MPRRVHRPRRYTAGRKYNAQLAPVPLPMKMSPEAAEAWRSRMGWTIARTARAIGITQRTWVRWVQGPGVPPLWLSRALRDIEHDLTGKFDRSDTFEIGLPTF